MNPRTREPSSLVPFDVTVGLVRSGCCEESGHGWPGLSRSSQQGRCVKQTLRVKYRCLVWTSCVEGYAVRFSKEVIQPHLPIRLPCYDFTPVMDHSVGVVPLAVRLTPSGATHSHGVTGGVYKARERIHRGIADPRLLAIPTSWSRVADSNPDWDRLSGIGSTSRYCNPLYRPL